MLSQGQRFILISTVFFTVMNVCVKALHTIPTHQIVFMRGLIALVICSVMIYRKGIPFWGTNKTLLLLRGISGTCALGIYFYTLKVLPLATAVSIQHLSPIFTALLACVLVRERIAPSKFVFFIIAFAGVLLIKGFDPQVNLGDVAIAISAALFAGIAYNIIRLLKDKEDPLTVVLYFPLCTVPTVGSYTLRHWVWPTPREWVLLLVIGISVQIAQIFMTKGYQSERASRVAHLNYLMVLYSLVIGYVAFDEKLHIVSVVGIGVLLLGVIGASKTEWPRPY
jgi:drug/metabolite transporter (DMT)-like permease